MPNALGRRALPAQDVEIAIVGTSFIRGVLRAVPLVKDRLDQVFATAKPETNRPFVGLPPTIAIYFQLHIPILAQRRHAQGANALQPAPNQERSLGRLSAQA